MHRLLNYLTLATGLLSIAANLDAAPPISPYGVHAHLPRGDEFKTAERELAMIRDAGMGAVRCGFVWRSLEPKQGEFQFERTDQVVEWAAEQNIEILGLLHAPPTWAVPAHEHLDEWLAFVRNVVGRYKGRVRYWQVWNEPNLQSFWPDPDPDDYVTLLKPTAAAIREVNPQAVVVYGATSRIDWKFIRRTFELGAGESFDVMAVHPYGYPAAPESYIPGAVADLRKLMLEFDVADRPIWFTEWGWPTHKTQRGVALHQQNRLVVRAVLTAIAAGIERMFHYEFVDLGTDPADNEQNFGLLHHDLKPKPAYFAYKTLTRARPAGSTQIKTWWNDGGTYHAAWRRPDGRKGHALWRTWGHAKPMAIEIKGTLVEARDLAGRPLGVSPEGGVLRLELGDEPVFLIGPDEIQLQ